MNKLTKNTLIAEVVQNYPELAEVLTMDYGFHCIGCFASEMETLEQGAMVHGMSKTEITSMIKTLNGILEDKVKEETSIGSKNKSKKIPE